MGEEDGQPAGHVLQGVRRAVIEAIQSTVASHRGKKEPKLGKGNLFDDNNAASVVMFVSLILAECMHTMAVL